MSNADKRWPGSRVIERRFNRGYWIGKRLRHRRVQNLTVASVGDFESQHPFAKCDLNLHAAEIPEYAIRPPLYRQQEEC